MNPLHQQKFTFSVKTWIIFDQQLVKGTHRMELFLLCRRIQNKRYRKKETTALSSLNVFHRTGWSVESLATELLPIGVNATYFHSSRLLETITEANIWHGAYLNLLADLDELGHLILQFTVPLHQVGQVVLQSLLFGGRHKKEAEGTRTEEEKRLDKLSGCVWTAQVRLWTNPCLCTNASGNQII